MRRASFYSIAGPARKFHQGYLLARCAGKHVLEYGCGPGTNASVLARQAATVTGNDISDVAIAQARERAQRERVPNVVFQVMDAENPTLPDDTYDLISGRLIIHHLDLHKALAFSQLARIMARDGSAILYEPLGHNPFINLYRWLTPNLRTPDERPLLLSDLDVAAQYFDHVEPHFFTLSPLLAVPFRRTRGCGTAPCSRSASLSNSFASPEVRLANYPCAVSSERCRPRVDHGVAREHQGPT